LNREAGDGLWDATPTVDVISQRVKIDLWYINNRSLWLDLQILIKTFFRSLAQTQRILTGLSSGGWPNSIVAATARRGGSTVPASRQLQPKAMILRSPIGNVVHLPSINVGRLNSYGWPHEPLSARLTRCVPDELEYR
jgi:hypothetical protein